MKYPIFIILILILGYQCIAQEASIAPISIDFVNWKSTKNNRTVIIPTPIKPHFTKHIKNTKELPSSYDLRTENLVSPVKDQANCGACWMFTSMASIESNWLLNGYGMYDLSEQSLKNCHGFAKNGCEGGNHLYTTAYLMRGDGPILENEVPYNVSDTICNKNYSPVKQISEAVFLPPDPEIIKQAILDYGALYTSMYFKNISYNTFSNSYYYNGDEPVNHGVTLIGWDDNKSTQGGTGAWLAKNSFGTNWGANGYFYISYNDSKILSDNACFPKTEEYQIEKTIYQYDALGWITNIGYGNDAAHALIKYKASDNQKITKVGTYICSENASAQVSVYYGKNQDELIYEIGKSDMQYFDFPGFYWIELNNPVRISKGETFYIKVKYKTPGYNYPIPLEAEVEDYSYPSIEQNVCWISKNTSSWETIGYNIKEMQVDLCIKAYAIPAKDSVVSDEHIIISPNPFNRYLEIGFGNPIQKNFIITIFNTNGQSVYSKKFSSETEIYQLRLDLPQLRNGIYYLDITGDIQYSQRIIKL